MKDLIKKHGVALLAIIGLLLFSIPLGVLIASAITMPWLLMVIGAIMFTTAVIIASSEDSY